MKCKRRAADLNSPGCLPDDVQAVQSWRRSGLLGRPVALSGCEPGWLGYILAGRAVDYDVLLHPRPDRKLPPPWPFRKSSSSAGPMSARAACSTGWPACGIAIVDDQPGVTRDRVDYLMCARGPVLRAGRHRRHRHRGRRQPHQAHRRADSDGHRLGRRDPVRRRHPRRPDAARRGGRPAAAVRRRAGDLRRQQDRRREARRRRPTSSTGWAAARSCRSARSRTATHGAART